jgi:isopentenyl-diphosphate delta-isomerase
MVFGTIGRVLGYSCTLQRFPKLNPHFQRQVNLQFATNSAINTKPKSKMPSVLTKEIEDSIDPFQKALLAEECILVDPDDKVLGHDTKKNCHLVGPNGDIPLHRAFSVFLFNTKGELLLQKRSSVKVTFPSMYTNTCCSHPLFRNDEMVENEALGVKTAAQRRLFEELGIAKEEVPIDAFQYLTRIHYKANSNSIWGEHEVDYILFLQRDVKMNPNPNEIDDVRYVNLEQLMELKQKDGVALTPWFNLILESGKLAQWWKNLGNLAQFKDHDKVHKLGLFN